MIGYIQGEILDHFDGKILIGIGDRQNSSGRVGYSVSVPQSPEYGAFLTGQKVELFVYTHVREDQLELYGFTSRSEKALFLTLLSVSGIGPKSALGILSGMDTGQLIEAIIQGEPALLTRVPGIGKKTAERVVVELRDSIKKKWEAGVFSEKTPGKEIQKPSVMAGAHKNPNTLSDSHLIQDAKAALLGLGYREQDIHPLLKRTLENVDPRPQKVEDLIRAALRQLA
jgi:holliday junction DNA helicase RuvA